MNTINSPYINNLSEIYPKKLQKITLYYQLKESYLHINTDNN